eukprot:Plantae.Rhodophyta-Hildenbrandia_rubra.ctg21307.p1 GENE.Plantae.Rhodophyta-Hildenbrandia_rubra.ctg21307~~Plantae.Rhodophyta-Hildenbrandia_rubra.ctg21307.p1  ORF type:complete len:257 (+),score=25.41 Plantae.Rhodophyta-Hildenbrandia_rubra.ctg21307:100-870(+)
MAFISTCSIAALVKSTSTKKHIQTRVAIRNRCRRCSRTLVTSSAEASSTTSTTPLYTTKDTARLARALAADWANQAQAFENPTFWAHIHVCFRPLPYSLLDGHALYCESAYDYNLGLPYKTSVVKVVVANEGCCLELENYKIKDKEEFYLGAHEPQLLDALEKDMLFKLPDCCNTVYEWLEGKQIWKGYTRPGKECRIKRQGQDSYLDSKIELQVDRYSSWDVGRDPVSDDRIWGGAAGPFEFVPNKKLDHLVEDR